MKKKKIQSFFFCCFIFFPLKHEHFRFYFPVFTTLDIHQSNEKIKWNPPIDCQQMTMVFRQHCWLLQFHIRNRIFTYVIFPSKNEKLSNRSSEFPEIHQLKYKCVINRKEQLITRVFWKLTVCTIYVFFFLPIFAWLQYRV